MKKKRFPEEKIIKILNRLETGEKAKDLAREIGVQQQTIYSWRLKYGGLEVSDLKELKRLQDENNRLKKMVADQDLDIVMLKDINSRKW
jgi:putative transposase